MAIRPLVVFQTWAGNVRSFYADRRVLRRLKYILHRGHSYPSLTLDGMNVAVGRPSRSENRFRTGTNTSTRRIRTILRQARQRRGRTRTEDTPRKSKCASSGRFGGYRPSGTKRRYKTNSGKQRAISLSNMIEHSFANSGRKRTFKVGHTSGGKRSMF